MARKTGSRRVAFLRGINVGGAGLLKMSDLRRLSTKLGFREVTTMGASGNLFYMSPWTPKDDRRRLEDALTQRMGKATVVVRTAAQLGRLVRRAPFTRPDPKVPDKWCMIAFLARPSRKPLPKAPSADIRFEGRTTGEVFYKMLQPSSTAIGMAARLEHALGSSITVRNWNVVRTVALTLEGTPA